MDDNARKTVAKWISRILNAKHTTAHYQEYYRVQDTIKGQQLVKQLESEIIDPELWKQIAKCSENNSLLTWKLIIQHTSNITVLQEAMRWIEVAVDWKKPERKQAIPLLRDIAGKVRKSAPRDKTLTVWDLLDAYCLREDICRLATRCGADGIPLLNVMLERDQSLLSSVLSEASHLCKAGLPIFKWLVSQRYIINKRNLGMRLSLNKDCIPVWEWLMEQGYEIDMKVLAGTVPYEGEWGLPVLEWIVSKTDLSSVVTWSAEQVGASLKRENTWFVIWILENSSDMDVLKLTAYEAGRSGTYGIGVLELIWKKSTDQSILLEAAKGVWSLREIEVPILEWIYERAVELEVIKAIVMMGEKEYISCIHARLAFIKEVRDKSMETRHSLLLLKVLASNTESELLIQVALSAGWIGDVGTIVLYQLVEKTDCQEVLLSVAQSASSIGASGIPLLERLVEKTDPVLVLNHAATGVTLFRKPDLKVLNWIIGRTSNDEVLLLVAKATQVVKNLDSATLSSLIESSDDSDVLVEVAKALKERDAIAHKPELLTRILEKSNDNSVVLEVAWSAGWLGEAGIPILERMAGKSDDVIVLRAVISGAIDNCSDVCVPIFEWLKSRAVDSELWEHASKWVTVEDRSNALAWLKEQGLYQDPGDG